MDYTTLHLPVIESRCDWLTATASNFAQHQSLLYVGEQLGADDEKRGDRIETWGFQGYRGFQTSSVRYGYRDDGAILILSGETAGEYIQHVATVAEHFSRVDYCVTAVDEEERIAPPVDYWDKWPYFGSRAGGHPGLTRIQNSVGGSTIAIGARSSAYYARCYDKTAESKGVYPKRSWRWEVEFKRHASEAEHHTWRKGPLGQGAIRAIVAREFVRQGFMVPWTRDDPNPRAAPPPRQHDADRALEWLKEQVGPCVAWLCEARGEEQVLGALGIRRPKPSSSSGP
jgi:Replication initiation factor